MESTSNSSAVPNSRCPVASSTSASPRQREEEDHPEEIWRSQFKRILLVVALLLVMMSSVALPSEAAYAPSKSSPKTNAYATMLYMGTPRDYEFYVAARVMLQTLLHFKVDADLVVIASQDVPLKWTKTL
jgi:hypothetical protein